MSTEPVDHIDDRLKRAQDEGGYWGAAYFHDVLHLRRERDALRAERDALRASRDNWRSTAQTFMQWRNEAE